MKRYCPNCCQNVNTVPGLRWGPLILGILFGILPGILYWYFKREDICPMCHCKESELLPPKAPSPNQIDEY